MRLNPCKFIQQLLAIKLKKNQKKKKQQQQQKRRKSRATKMKQTRKYV